jgi:asparagine synthase (glutamine-hydrolysing)
MTLDRHEFISGSLTQAAAAKDASPNTVDALRGMSVDALQRLVADAPGAFALGLHLHDGSSFLAVDRFAIRSACYRVIDGRLQFAQRADAWGEAAAELDPQAVFDYLYFHAIPSPRTVFSGVQRLPPGHCAIMQNGSLRVLPYWKPQFAPQQTGVSFDRLKAEFRDILAQSVTRQLDGGKAACFLSGGTDSSTVAGMLAQTLGKGPASYSIGFEAEGYDEMAFARIASKHFGCEHHEYYVTPDDLVRSIPDVAAFYDQPFGNSSAVPAYYCARMAQADGVTRILAGDGGDELFGGNKRYATQRVFGVYDATPPWVRGALEPLIANSLAASIPVLRKGSSYVKQARVPLPDRLQTYNLLQRLGIDDVLTPSFLSGVNRLAPQQQQREVWQQSHGAHPLDRQLAFDWRYTLAENDLPKVCGTTQLAAIEVAFPMLDKQLVDFSLRLPTHYKLKGLKLRWFFKEALRGFLPDEIIVKKKQGFGLPFGVWALRHAGLGALARDALGTLSTRDIVQPAFIKDLLDHKLAEHPGYYGEMVWILMMLEHWMRRHAPNYRAGR